MYYKLPKFIPGQALVEVVIALGVVIVGLMALVSLGTKSVNTSGYAARESRASAYASQAIELVRSKKDTLGWNEFKSSYSGTRCGTNLNSGACGIAGTEFTSQVIITPFTEPSGKETLIVVVTVSWPEGNETASGRTAQVDKEVVFAKY